MRRSRLAVLPVVLLAVLGGSAPSVPAQELPLPLPAGRLAYATAVYEAHDDGSAGIRVDGLGTMRLDGTDRRTLTSPSPAYDHTPDWSPDGRWLVSMRTQHEPTSATSTEVRITSADGSRSDVVGYGSWPTWSPDGTRIAWSSMDPDRPGVFLLTVDHSGDEVVVDPAGPRLMPTPRRTFAPSWSPLGIALAVWVQRPETEYDQDLWHLDTATGDARQLTQDVWQSFGAQRPSWHPSGLVLAVIAEEPSRPGASQAWLVRPDGSGVTRLVPEQPDLYYSWVAWAPDGLSLALQSNHTQDGVLVVSATGQVLQRLAVDELDQVTSPVWSPDGTHLFAVADDRANGFEAWKPELWAIPRAGLPPQQLTTDSSVFPFTTTAVDPGLAKRLFGPTPADTAAEVADQLPDSDTVVVTTPAGAAVATPLAVVQGAPILESSRDSLPAATVDAVTERRPSTAWVVGDVSPAVDTQLRARGVSTVRSLTGSDLATVAAGVSGEVPATTAFLAPARSRVEQAASAAIAGARREPLLLTDREALPASTREALQRLGVRRVVLTASLSAVSATVVDELRALGIQVQRFGGATPARAALGLARAYAPASSLERPVVVSQGAPGVAAALRAASRRTVLLPVGRGAHDPAIAFLRQHRAAVAEVEVLAPPGSVTPAVETAVEGAVQ